MLQRTTCRIVLTVVHSSLLLTAVDLPSPIDLAVPLVNQKTETWCWLAVAQMAMQYRNGRSPEQCEMAPVDRASEKLNCCKSPSRCASTGTIEGIQKILSEAGNLRSAISGPINFGQLYNSIRQGNPVAIAYDSGEQKFHVVIARGMKFYGTAESITPMVLVNDPMASEPLWIPYKRLQETWTSLLVIGKAESTKSPRRPLKSSGID